MGLHPVLLGLALLATSAQALRCLQGSVYVDQTGATTYAQTHTVSCDGVCSTRITNLPFVGKLHVLSCEEEFRTKKMVIGDDVCLEDLCNAVPGIKLEKEDMRVSEAIEDENWQCYVGVKHGNYSVGGTQLCDGDCAAITSTANGLPSYIFFCAPHPLCRGFLNGSDDGIFQLDDGVTGMCCSTEPNCNGKDIVPTMPPLPTGWRQPIACYSGIWLGSKPLTPGQYVPCQGDCSSLSYHLSDDNDFTFYGCDPATVCRGFGIKNRCAKIDEGTFNACCCDTDDCIDPSRVPPVNPDNPVPEWIQCYAGVHIRYPDAPFDTGDVMYCHGSCGSSNITLNGVEIETFFCADDDLCSNLEVVGGCDTLAVGDQSLDVCCCNDQDMCNTHGKDIPSVAPATITTPQMIACFQGLRINNIQLSGEYIACNGDCASLTLPTTLRDNPYAVTLFTCDPATVCRGLGMINNCAGINGTISGCCCDTDVCINPLQNKYPNGTFDQDLKCFSGIAINGSSQVYGGSLPCDGECASFRSTISGTSTAGYFCAPKSLCHKLGVHNDCGQLPGSLSSNGCCCDWDDNCNAVMDNIPVPPYVKPDRPPLACYAGLSYNGSMLSDADRFMTCRGDCAALTFTAIIADTPHSITMYSCDPTNVCSSLGIQDRCAYVGGDDTGSLSGCCCSWNDCIDLNTGKLKPTNDNLQCFVGTSVEAKDGTVYTTGDTMQCGGKCASVETTINGLNSWAFFCATTKACQLVQQNDTACSTLFTDNMDHIQSCCCDDSDNCNFNMANVGTLAPPTTAVPDNRAPIVCYSGLSQDGKLLTPVDSYMLCRGDCASASYRTVFSGKNVTTTIYSCDPVTYCSSLQLGNSCGEVKNGDSATSVYGCCCNWDDCIDTSNNGFIKPTNQTIRADNLQCLVGYSVDYQGAGQNQFVGSAMPCDGQCASVQTVVGNTHMTGYFCAPNSLCKATNLEDNCGTIFGDQYVHACCCQDKINCNNVDNLDVPPYQPSTTAPIACYAGLALNGQLLTDGNQYMACQGDCALFTFHATAGGTNVSTTIFSCDPAAICDSVKLKEGCASIGSVIDGCCCSSNDCIDISKRQVKPTRNNLQCFLGLSTEGHVTGTYGESQPCDGQCSSLQTQVNGLNTWGFFCAPDALCDAMNKTGSCQTIFDPSSSAYVKTCCCYDENDCNFKNANVQPAPTIPPAPTGLTPIACYSGIAVNGVNVGPLDTYSACFGSCTAITYSTKFAMSSYDATIYTCDPIQLCNHYGIDGNCATILAGDSTVTGCCCGFDDCLEISTGRIKRKHEDSQQCFVGVATVGSVINSTYGQSLPCDGQCGSFQTVFRDHQALGFYCASNAFCNSLNLTNHCGSLNTDDGNMTYCCCNDKDNCNLNNVVVPLPPAPTLPPPKPIGAPITCYNGLAINGKYLSATNSYSTCYGECISLTYASSYMSQSVLATVFSCDPAEMCDHYGSSGGCATIFGDTGSNAVKGCCCNWNDCLDNLGNPKRTNETHRPDNLACVVGVSYQNGSSSAVLLGGSMKCDGSCISIDTQVNSITLTGYYCVEPSLCKRLGVENTCSGLPGDETTNACCCASSENCNNIHSLSFQPTTTPNEAPLACYSGLSVNGMQLSDPNSYMACQGKCGLVSFTTSVSGKQYTNTLYGCNPVEVCDPLKLKDSCGQVLNGMIQGCCCGWSDCIDTTHGTVKPQPKDSLQCFSGISTGSGDKYTSVGTTAPCDGQCASFESNINNQRALVFFCAQGRLCNVLNLTNTCYDLPGADGTMHACCCNDDDVCNINNAQVGPVPTLPPTPTGLSPITCYSGVAVNGTLLTPKDSYASCFGDCSAMSYVSRFSGKILTTTVFSCDPSSVCTTLGMDNNQCHDIDTGSNATSLSGCCCTWNDCINLDDGTVKPMENNGGQCFSGIATGAPGNYSVIGTSTFCDGQCASIESNINNQEAWVFFCAGGRLCDVINLADGCKTLDQDKTVTGCCCRNTDNCNILALDNGPIPTLPAPTGSLNPIACYTGVSINGKLLTQADSYTTCLGDCSAMSYKSQFGDRNFSMTVFSCDPSTLCTQLQMDDRCADIPTGTNQTTLSGCCCTWDDCIQLDDGTLKKQPTMMLPTTTKSSSTISVLSVLVFSLFTFLSRS